MTLKEAQEIIKNTSVEFNIAQPHVLYFEAKAFMEGRASVLKSKELEDLLEYLVHDNTCILSYWEAGEPMPDGGYRSKYNGKWYEAKPVDKTPKCDCRCEEALSAFHRFANEGEGK